MYYNEPSFSDVSINMSEEESEDYNTYEGACFGKVFYLTKFYIDKYCNAYFILAGSYVD